MPMECVVAQAAASVTAVMGPSGYVKATVYSLRTRGRASMKLCEPIGQILQKLSN